jgi:hypothetical protein
MDQQVGDKHVDRRKHRNTDGRKVTSSRLDEKTDEKTNEKTNEKTDEKTDEKREGERQ